MGNHWMPAKNNYLFPAAALAKVFRAKFRRQLSHYEEIYKSVRSRVWSTDWVIDIRPVGNGQSAFRYLAPYIFRVALSNKRILNCKEGEVTFLCKDSKSQDQKLKQITLPVEAFITGFSNTFSLCASAKCDTTDCSLPIKNTYSKKLSSSFQPSLQNQNQILANVLIKFLFVLAAPSQ